MRLLAVPAGCAVLLACGADAPTVEIGDTPGRIEILAGNHQQVDPGSTLPVNLEVRVTDPDGLPVPRVPIEWIVEGGGQLRPFNRSTDVGGKVVAELTLTHTIGVREVVARVATDTALFTAFTVFGGVSSRPKDLPEAEILISVSGFEPSVAAVPAGGYVRFIWAGDSPHDVRFDDANVGRIYMRIEGTRDVYLFDPGDYPYRCSGFREGGGFVTVDDYPEHLPHSGRVIVN